MQSLGIDVLHLTNWYHFKGQTSFLITRQLTITFNCFLANIAV